MIHSCCAGDETCSLLKTRLKREVETPVQEMNLTKTPDWFSTTFMASFEPKDTSSQSPEQIQFSTTFMASFEQKVISNQPGVTPKFKSVLV